ncbi:hypothetical protein [Enterovibrio paralichthyis]|uniref:hypothetical protein n=1 Tax=Enterovibrio paralichthyis TaxID=2853805 RepID=UPI001C490CC2|nr:hypothetical protein [Enterovibrio paralichthyis]MBV7299686.1 hypothetical protein [Enterovibrio paralichthyis]
MKKSIKASATALFIVLGLTACGSAVITKETGISDQQIIYIVGDDLNNYLVSVGNIEKHKISNSDLESDTTSVLTSTNSQWQNSDVLKIIVSQGENHLEVINNNGAIVYKNDIYLSRGQSTLINVK